MLGSQVTEKGPPHNKLFTVDAIIDGVVQCGAVCCRVLQCVAVAVCCSCSVLLFVSICFNLLQL